MVKCSRCGRSMGKAEACPHCGSGPSMSVLDKSVVKVAKATGTALEVGVQITEKVVHDAKPVVKSVLKESRKGIKKAREGTLKVAKSLKEDNE
jgi:RNA polymerase subunit RPABC4/transcription elongation factor Spt4